MVRIVALLLALVCGTASSQFPEFTQQYRQRLGGAIDALQAVVDDFRRDAEASGLSVPQAVADMSASTDPLIVRRGHSMERAVVRLEALRSQRDALQDAGAFRRAALVAADLDGPLAQATWSAFEPAVPVTAAGFISAALGAVTGWVLALLGHQGARQGLRLTTRRGRQV